VISIILEKVKYLETLFINIILAFSNIDSDLNNNTNSDFFDSNIIVLKKVRSLRQLKRTEKELVKLCYKEAIIKGFTLKGIQQYIASKTKIWIEWSCLEKLKKTEEQENREWFYHMAHDHFAYVGAYRKCIDEISQYKKEVWNIVIDSKTDNTVRIQALKELHSLSKTYTLLIKDIPFVTNISKDYDKDIINSNYGDLSHPKGTYTNNNDTKNHNYYNKSVIKINSSRIGDPGNQFYFDDLKDSRITDTINNIANASQPYEDKLSKELQAQLNYKSDDLISQEHLETIKGSEKLEEK
jgi:hypothetical protein